MKRKLAGSLAVLLATACTMPEQRTIPPPINPPGIGRATLVQVGDEPPFTQAEFHCLRNVFREIGNRQVTYIGAVQNDAVYLGGPLQVSYRSDLKGFLTALGLRPVERPVTTVDVVIVGALSGFARLVGGLESGVDIGILTRAFDFQPSRSTVFREGNVTARVVIDVPYEQDGKLTYAGFTTATATVSYYSHQTEGRITGTVVAVSGGFATKRVAIIDSQTSASFAIKIAAIGALTNYLEAKGVHSLATRARSCLAA